MGAVATLDIDAWRAVFPEFSNVSNAAVKAGWAEAGLYHNNGQCGVVCDVDQQTQLMSLVTAHIVQLRAKALGAPIETGVPQLVGGIITATEGTVSVGTQNQYPPGCVQWWQQTQYGAAYWTATAPYRTMHWRTSAMAGGGMGGFASLRGPTGWLR